MMRGAEIPQATIDLNYQLQKIKIIPLYICREQR